jgi:hypothetical protein
MLEGEPEYELFVVLGTWLGVPGFSNRAKKMGMEIPKPPDEETLTDELHRVAGLLASLAEDLASPDAPVNLRKSRSSSTITVRLSDRLR